MENKKYIVYTISLDGVVMYVGKTNDYYGRKWRHLNGINNKKYHSAIPDGTSPDLIDFSILETFDNQHDAIIAEGDYILKYNTLEPNGWNKNNSGYKDIKHPHPEKERARQREYYKEHKEERKKYIKKYRQEHKDELNEKKRLKYNSNLEKSRKINNDKMQRYRDSHRKEYAAYQREYQKNYRKKKAS